MVVELPYSLHTRYRSIAIAWIIIIIPPIFINLGSFYGLWYGRPDMDRIAGRSPLASHSSQPALTHHSPDNPNCCLGHIHSHSDRRKNLEAYPALARV